jgi:hypothetical protein
MVTIILQGILCPHVDIFKTLDEYSRICDRIVLSIYKEREDPRTIHELETRYPAVQICDNRLEDYVTGLKALNKFSGIPYQDNCFYQINSTLKALETVTTDLVVKTRVDHYYSDIATMIELCKKQKKIVASSVCTGSLQKKCMVSDCLFIGPTEEIQSVFRLALEDYEADWFFETPEMKIWKPYIMGKAFHRNVSIENTDEYLDFMESLFEIYPVTKHRSYKLRFGSFTNSNDIKENMDYLVQRTSREYFIHGH